MAVHWASAGTVVREMREALAISDEPAAKRDPGDIDISWIPVERCKKPVLFQAHAVFKAAPAPASAHCRGSRCSQGAVQQAQRAEPPQKPRGSITEENLLLGGGIEVGVGAWAERPRVFMMRQALAMRDGLQQKLQAPPAKAPQPGDQHSCAEPGSRTDDAAEEEDHEVAGRRPLLEEEGLDMADGVFSSVGEGGMEHVITPRPLPPKSGHAEPRCGGAKGTSRKSEAWDKRVAMLQEDLSYHKLRANSAHEQLVLAAGEAGQAWGLCRELQDELKACKATLVFDAQVQRASEELEEVQDARLRCTASESEAQELRQRVAYQEAAMVLLQESLFNKDLELSNKHSELEYTRGELVSAQSELSRAHSSLKEARGELQSTQGHLRDARCELEGSHDVRVELQTTQGDLARTRKELDQTREALHKTQAELTCASSQLEMQRGELRGAHAQLEFVKEELEAERRQADSGSGRLQSAQREAIEAAQRADELRGKVAEMQRRMDMHALETEERVSSCQARCVDKEAALASLQRQHTRAIKAEARLQAQLSAAKEVESERAMKLALLEEVGVALINRFSDNSAASVPKGPITGPDPSAGRDFNQRLDALVAMACAQLDELEDTQCIPGGGSSDGFAGGWCEKFSRTVEESPQRNGACEMW